MFTFVECFLRASQNWLQFARSIKQEFLHCDKMMLIWCCFFFGFWKFSETVPFSGQLKVNIQNLDILSAPYESSCSPFFLAIWLVCIPCSPCSDKPTWNCMIELYITVCSIFFGWYPHDIPIVSHSKRLWLIYTQISYCWLYIVVACFIPIYIYI